MRRMLTMLVFVSIIFSGAISPAAETGLDRTTLPIKLSEFKGKISETFEDSKQDSPQPVEAPKGAPNVVLILIDDFGFGHPGTFGGPIPTPALDRLAKHGLRYNTFHTTAICSPTRAALLKGGDGVLVANGGSSAGYTLYVINGKPVYEMNFFGKERYSVKSSEAIPAGKVTLTMSYIQQGEAPKGGTATLLVNGKAVASGKIDMVPPVRYSATETLDIGMDLGSVVSPSYHDKAPFAFDGKIEKVVFELK